MAREDVSAPESKPQRDRFVETARELECDEDEDRFNETLKRVVKKRDNEQVRSPSSRSSD